MRKLRKILLITVITLLVLGVGAHLLLLYQSQAIVERLVKKLSKGSYEAHTKDVHFFYRPTGILIEGLDLRPAGGKAGTLVKADSVQVSLTSLWALLFNKQLDIELLQVVNPQLTLLAAGHRHAQHAPKSVAAALDSLQQQVFRQFQTLDIRHAAIKNADLTITDSTAQRILFGINHLDILVNDLNLDPERQPNEPIARTGILRLRKPQVQLPDSNLRVQLGLLEVNGLQGDLSIDSLDVQYKTRFEEQESVQLSSIDVRGFRWQHFLKTSEIEIDSVLAAQGRISLDLADEIAAKQQKSTSTKRTPYQGHPLLLHYVQVSDMAYSIRTKTFADRDSDESMLSLSGKNLLLKQVSLQPLRQPQFQIEGMTIRITDFQDRDDNNLYQLKLQDLAIDNGQLIMQGYQLRERKSQTATANQIMIPTLRVSDYSLPDLLLKKLKAKRLQLLNPTVEVATMKAASRPDGLSANARGERLNKKVDKTLRGVQQALSLDEVEVRNASVILSPQQSGASQLKLAGLSLMVNGQKLLGATNAMEIIHAIDRLTTDGFTLTGKNIQLRISAARLLNNPRGFYFGRITGKFGEDTEVDLQGVTILNALNTLDLTRADGLRISDLLVEGGTILLRKKHQQPAAKDSVSSNPLHLIADKLRLNNIVLKMIDSNRTAASAAFDVAATNFEWRDKHASWQTLVLGSKANQLESGTTQLEAGNLEIVQPGTVRIRQVKGANSKGHTAISFEAELLEAALGVTSTDLPELRVTSLLMNNSRLKLTTTLPDSASPARTSASASRAADKPLQLQQLLLTNANVELLMQRRNGDTAYHANINSGRLECQQVSYKLFEGEPLLHADQIKYSSTKIGAGFARRFFQPAAVHMQLSDINLRPKSKRLSLMVDSIRLLSLAHTIVSDKGDTTIMSAAELGATQFAYNNRDTLNWRTLLVNNHWWANGVQLIRKNNRQQLSAFGLQARQNKSLRIAMDSLQLLPALAREEHWLSHPFETDHIQFKTGKLVLEDVKPDFSDSSAKLHIHAVKVWDWLLHPQRDKTRPEDTVTYRPLLAQQIMRIPILFKVDSVYLQNGRIQYNEIGQKTGKEGSIYLDQIKGSIAHLRNWDHHDKDSLIMIMDSRLYGKGQMRINFRQSYTDTLQGFWMRVRMGSFPMPEMNTMLRPLMGLRIYNGVVDTLTMIVNGNQHFAFGTMDLRYHKMNVQKLSADGKEKYFMSGALNWLINQVVRRRDNGRPNLIFKQRVVKRGQFNYWGKIAVEGLLTNIGIKTDRKERRKFLKNLQQYKLPADYWNADDL